MSNKDTIESGDLLTVPDAALLLRCQPSTIRPWFTLGRLPRTKVGRLTRVLRRDLESFILAGRTQEKPDEH